MKYLSWDVGIKNLAFCIVELDLFDSNIYKICEWEVINLYKEEKPVGEYLCSEKKKDGIECLKTATLYENEQLKCLCKTHSKKYNTENISEIKKLTCMHIMKNGNMCQKKQKFKTDNMLIGYCRDHSKKVNCYLKEIKKVKKNKHEIDAISKKLIEELDKRKYLLEVDTILIENQPAMKNPKMKSIQMILYTYFLIRGKIDNNKEFIKRLNFLMATNKLKIKLDNEDTQKELEEQVNKKTSDKYKRRKLLSIKYTEYLIANDNEKWIKFFDKSKKKDDLADTFLMNIYQIQNDN